MNIVQEIDHSVQRVGEEWIRAMLEKNFQSLAGICQADVRSRLMTPRRFDSFETVSDLTAKIEGWFQACSSIQKEQSRIGRVGESLAIFYRLSFVKEGQPKTAEQQLYCTLRGGLIDQLNLLCSGFQPVQVQVEVPVSGAENSVSLQLGLNPQPPLRANAFLKLDAGPGQGSTCAILTPAIKHKLGEMSPGQVLEVCVNDPSAKEDIEAWCRLTGNPLLQSDLGAGQELHFFLMKKVTSH